MARLPRGLCVLVLAFVVGGCGPSAAVPSGSATSADSIRILSVSPAEGELVRETTVRFDIRVGYRLSTSDLAEVLVLLEMDDGMVMADPFVSAVQVERGEGEVDLAVEAWVPESAKLTSVRLSVQLSAPDEHSPLLLATAQGGTYPIVASIGAAPAEQSADVVRILTISPSEGEITPETPQIFDIRVAYRLATADSGALVVVLEAADGLFEATALSPPEVARGEGELDLRVEVWMPASADSTTVKLTVNLFVSDGDGKPLARAAESPALEYPVGLLGSAAATPTAEAPGAAPAPTQAPGVPTIQARPAAAKPGDRVDFVVSGFPIPVTVVHLERVLPDGRKLPLGRSGQGLKHDWGGPYETWWIDDLNYLGAGPWPSGVYVERFEVEGVMYDVPVTVESPAEGTPLGPRHVSARAERIGTADRVVLMFSGFPLLTAISLKEIVPPEGLTTPYDWSEVTTAFEYTWPSYPVFHVDEPRGTYVFLFDVDGVEYKAAVELSP